MLNSIFPITILLVLIAICYWAPFVIWLAVAYAVVYGLFYFAAILARSHAKKHRPRYQAPQRPIF